MKIILFIFLSVFSSLSLANSAYDVIHTTDGDVIRGNIIERDFDNQQYAIQLFNGQIATIPENHIAHLEQLDLSESFTTSQYTPVYSKSNAKMAHFGTLYIGTTVHTLTSQSGIYTKDATYTGINISGQLNLSKHLAMYGGVSIAEFSRLTISDGIGESFKQSGSALPDESYTSKQLGLIVSSNLSTGWQIFTGSGGFIENYATSSANFEAAGANLQFGVGYSWQGLQITARIHALFSPDYTDAVERSTTGHIQMGFNF